MKIPAWLPPHLPTLGLLIAYISLRPGPQHFPLFSKTRPIPVREALLVPGPRGDDFSQLHVGDKEEMPMWPAGAFDMDAFHQSGVMLEWYMGEIANTTDKNTCLAERHGYRSWLFQNSNNEKIIELHAAPHGNRHIVFDKTKKQPFGENMCMALAKDKNWEITTEVDRYNLRFVPIHIEKATIRKKCQESYDDWIGLHCAFSKSLFVDHCITASELQSLSEAYCRLYEEYCCSSLGDRDFRLEILNETTGKYTVYAINHSSGDTGMFALQSQKTVTDPMPNSTLYLQPRYLNVTADLITPPTSPGPYPLYMLTATKLGIAARIDPQSSSDVHFKIYEETPGNINKHPMLVHFMNREINNESNPSQCTLPNVQVYEPQSSGNSVQWEVVATDHLWSNKTWRVTCRDAYGFLEDLRFV